MVEPGKFMPGTTRELSATLGITWDAIARARRNLLALQRAHAASGTPNEQLLKDLEQAQQKLQETIQVRDAIESELAKSRECADRLTTENTQLQEKLTEAKAWIDNETDHLLMEEGLCDALHLNVDFLHQTMKHLDHVLDEPQPNVTFTSPYHGKRVVWIGCKECSECGAFKSYGMVRLPVADAEAALKVLSGQGGDVLVADLTVTGIDWLRDVHACWPDLMIVVMVPLADAKPITCAALESVATVLVLQPCEHANIGSTVRSVFLRKLVSDLGHSVNAHGAMGRPRVLVAEQEGASRELIAKQLTECGYEVVCVKDGVAALEAVEGGNCDILVTDVAIPLMDGVELTKKIKKLKPQFPVIALSDTQNADVSLEALLAGAYCYVPKPVRKDELALCIYRSMLVNQLEEELRSQSALLEMRINDLERTLSEMAEYANMMPVAGQPRPARSAGTKDAKSATVDGR